MTEQEYINYLRTPKKPKAIMYDDFISVTEIVIPDLFIRSGIGQKKVQAVVDYYKRFQRFDKPVTVKSRTDTYLTDGYARYVAAKILNVNLVPVVYS